MKRLLLIITITLLFTNAVQSQCPPNAFAFTSTYPQCPGGCGVLLKDWPEGVIVNIYGGTPLSIITSVVIPGTYGGPGLGSAFSCVPCGVPLVFASAIPGATNGCVITSLGVVPITLSSFSVATATNFTKTIKWAIANENSGDQYSIEKSNDGIHFISIAQIAGSGGLNKSYSIADPIINSGNISYRLKITEHAGNITYSKIVVAKGKNNGGISVFPNPTINNFNIVIAENLLPAQIKVYNAQGQQILQVIANNGTTSIHNKLAIGVYAVKVLTKNNEVITKTLIKN